MSRRRDSDKTANRGTECGYCGANIPDSAIICPKCGKWFSAAKKLAAVLVVSVILIAAAGSYFLFSPGQSAFIGSPDDGGDDSTGDDSTGDDAPTVELAPDFSYNAVNGGTVSLSGNRGKVIIIDFMATWCQPCKDQITNLKSIQEDYASRGVVIISLNVDQQVTDPELLAYRNEQGAQWGFATDTNGVSLNSKYSVSSIPTIVVIDKEGAIAKRNVGLMSVSALESAINPLL